LEGQIDNHPQAEQKVSGKVTQKIISAFGLLGLLLYQLIEKEM